MPTYVSLENDVEIWGRARGIIQNGKPMGQAIKTLEETTELIDAINRNDKDDIMDAIGDIVVTLLMQCAIHNVSLSECLEKAYEQIKDRKGYLTHDGIFHKESPPHLEVIEGFKQET